MAILQSQFSATKYAGIKIEVYEVAGSTNLINNTTDVIAVFHLCSMNNGTASCGTNKNAGISVAGQYKEIYVPAWNLARGEDWIVGSVRFTIPHETDGSKWCPFSVFYDTGTTQLGSAYLEGGIPLTVIPRASKLGLIPSFTYDENENVAIPFNVPLTKYASGFYNVLNMYFMNAKLEWVVLGVRENFDGGLVTLSVDELKKLYSTLPTIQTTRFKFELITYSDSTKSNLIGIDTNENAYGGMSNVGLAPTFDVKTVNLEDVNPKTLEITNDKSAFIKGYSDVKITFNSKAQANKGAILQDGSYTAQVITANGIKVQSLNHSDTFPKSLIFEKISDNKIDVFVFDSRSIRYPKNDEYQKVNLWDYKGINFNLDDCKVYRTNSVEASSFINLNGTYHDFPEKKGANQIVNALLKYKEKGSYEDYTVVNITTNIIFENGTFRLDNYSLGNFNVSNEYEFLIEIEDKLSKSTIPLILNSATPYIWHQRKSKKMGVGGKPNANNPSYSIQAFGGFVLPSGNLVLDYEITEEF